MSNFKSIRDLLGVTQAALATGMGCSQGNISFYEKGQSVPPDAAKRLIEFASTLGHTITFNDVYDDKLSEDTPMGDVRPATPADDFAQLAKEAAAPLTTDPKLRDDLVKGEQAGLVINPKPVKGSALPGEAE